MRRVYADRHKAEAIVSMAMLCLKRAEETNPREYASLVLKDYYAVLRELMAALALLDGYAFSGEGAHEQLINHCASGELASHRAFLQQLRDYSFVSPEYVTRNHRRILRIAMLLRKEIRNA